MKLLFLLSFFVVVLIVHFVKAVSYPVSYNSSVYAGSNRIGNGAPALNALVYNPRVVISSNGDLFILQNGMSDIRKVSKQTGVIDHFFTYESNNVKCIATSSSNGEWIYAVEVTETGGIISRVNTISAIYEIVFQDSTLSNPTGCSMNSKGNIAIQSVDLLSNNYAIYLYNTSSLSFSMVLGNPSNICEDGAIALSCKLFSSVLAISDNDRIYIASTQLWELWNGKVSIVKTQSSETLDAPIDMHMDRDSILMIYDFAYIQRYNCTSGEVSMVCGKEVGGTSPDGTLAIDAFLNPHFVSTDYNDGSIVISEYRKIRKIDPLTQKLLTLAGSGNEFFMNVDGITAKQTYFTDKQHPFLAQNDDLLMLASQYATNIFKINASDGRCLVYPLQDSNSLGYQSVASDPINGDIYYSKVGGLVYKINPETKSRSVFHSNTNTLLENTKISVFGGDFVGMSVYQDEIYFADFTHNVIRKITTNGNVVFVAGNGKAGFSGDGGLATMATLNSPAHALVDSKGDLWIADMGNNRVRKVSSGIITTVAGNGEVPVRGSPSTELINPVYLAESINGDAIYVSDFQGCLIKKIDKIFNNVSIIAGSASRYEQNFEPVPALSANFQPTSLVTVFRNSREIVYFSDMYNDFLRKIDDGVVSIYAGNTASSSPTDIPKEGPALNVPLPSPIGLVYDKLKGELYVSSSNEIRKITPDGTSILVAGSGSSVFNGDGLKAVNTSLLPNMLAIKDRNLLITDIDPETKFPSRMRSMSLDIESPTLNIIAGGLGDGLLSQNAFFYEVRFIQFDEKGNMYLLEGYSNSLYGIRVRKISRSSGIISTIAGDGSSLENGIPAIKTFFQAFTFHVVSEDLFLIPDMLNNRIIRISNGVANTIAGSITRGGGEPDYNVNATETSINLPSSSIQTPDGEVLFTYFYDDTIKFLKISKNTGRIEQLDIDSLPRTYGSTYLMRNKEGEILFTEYNTAGLVYKLTPWCKNGKLNRLKTQCVNECFGKADEISGCSSHGYCIAQDTCSCFGGYNGSVCQSYYCYGISNIDEKVCSGVGNCASPNNCKCKSGYLGEKCESFSCKGVKSTDLDVCSSRGECTAPDTCKCRANSFGSNCEMILQLSTSNLNSMRLNGGVSFRVSSFLLMLVLSLLIVM